MTHRTSSRLRRAGLAAAAVVSATALLAGCATATDDDAELTSLSYQTSWIPMVQFGGTYVAAEEGYFEAEGVDLEILPGGPEVDGMALLESGAADIAVTNTDFVARANAAGADLVIVAAGFQKSPLALLSLDSNPVTEPDDIAGARIGVPLGDTATHDAFVDVNGIDVSATEIVPIGFDVSPLLSGEVDAQYVFYTEQPIAVEDAGLVPETMLLADYNLNIYAQVYVVTRDTLETKRDAIIGFLTAEIKGWQDFVADPTLAVEQEQALAHGVQHGGVVLEHPGDLLFAQTVGLAAQSTSHEPRAEQAHEQDRERHQADEAQVLAHLVVDRGDGDADRDQADQRAVVEHRHDRADRGAQRAGVLLGEDAAMGYQRLVEFWVGETLPKEETRSNWLERPLSDSQLSYAALDVVYLLMVWQHQRESLERHGRLEWVLEDCNDLVAQSQRSSESDGQWYLRQMLGSMRSAGLADDLFGNQATEQFRDMQDSKLADSMAGDFGIADLLLKQFEGKI